MGKLEIHQIVMRFIIFIIVLIGLVVAGLTVMDYFGYYINWDKSILGITVLIPVAKAIQSFSSNTANEVKKIKEKLKK